MKLIEWFKKTLYKTLIISMLTILLSFFATNSVSKAALPEGEFYYSGTQDSQYVVEVSTFWSDIINLLANVVNYLIGIKTLADRGIIVGWVTLMEMTLSSILTLGEDIGTINDDAITTYAQNTVNIESILFNRVELLDPNIFKDYSTPATTETSTTTNMPIIMQTRNECVICGNSNGDEYCSECQWWLCNSCFDANHSAHDDPTISTVIENQSTVPIANSGNLSQNGGETTKAQSILKIIRNAVAKWYYIMRLICIVFMLLLLIFLGIKLAISSAIEEKAKYKQLLLDWLVGMIIIFSIHYIMVFILNFNEDMITSLSDMSKASGAYKEEYEYGEEKEDEVKLEDMEMTLYETARTRAYSLKATDGFMGMMLYATLVIYAWKFALIYMRRLINIVILTLMAPPVAASYAFNKLVSAKSKAKIFSTWLREYIINVFIQIVHVIMYITFVAIAFKLALTSLPGIILAFVIFQFMSKADKLLRKIFKMDAGKGSMAGDMADKTSFKGLKDEMIADTMFMGSATKAAASLTVKATTKPIRAVAERQFGKYMEKKANDPNFQAKRKQEKEEEENKFQDQYDEFRNAEEQDKREKELKEIRENLRAEREKLTENLKNAKDNKTKMQIQKDIEENEANILANDKDIEEFEKNKQENFKEFLRYYAQNHRIRDVLKAGIKDALDPYKYVKPEQDKDGTYKFKRIKTARKGGADKLFWREKKDGILKRLKTNFAPAELLGLNDKEEKILKDEIKFWKETLKGMVSGVAGVLSIGANPMVGMSLLSSGLNAQNNISNRFLNAITRPKASKTRKVYKFNSFSPPTEMRINILAQMGIEVLEDLDKIHNKKVDDEVKKAANLYYKTNTKELQKQYTSKYDAYEKEFEVEAKGKDDVELLKELLAQQDDVVNINGNLYGIDSENDNNDEFNKFMDEVKQIDAKNMNSKEVKTVQLETLINENKETLIKKAIEDVAMKKSITDISELKDLTSDDIIDVKENILSRLEKSGIVKKDEIKVEISNVDIKHVMKTLVDKKEETNENLEEKIVTSSILEYMAENNIRDIKNLKDDETKQKIYDIIRDRFMPEESKKSEAAIQAISGKSNNTAVYELSDEVKQFVDGKIDGVKRVDTNNQQIDRELLVMYAKNRKSNKTKDKLVKAVMTGDTQGLNSEELQLLDVLNQIGNQNLGANRNGEKNIADSNKKVKRKLKTYNQQDNKNSQSYDNERIQTIATKVYGPVSNVVDLINGKK